MVEDEVEVNVSSVLVTVMALVMVMNVSSVLVMALVKAKMVVLPSLELLDSQRVLGEGV